MTQVKRIDTTKRGIAAVWESGGGMTSGGAALIIAKRDGSKPCAAYVRHGGHLSCGEHALVPIHEGYYLVRAGVSRGTRSSCAIERIVSTTVRDIDGEKWEASAEVETVNTFSRGEWDGPLDEKLIPAVEAAFRKASTYHCRSAYYVDYSERFEPSAEDKLRRDAEVVAQNEERAELRQAKADREAKAKADAEAASVVAKAAGLGARISAASEKLVALGHDAIEQSDTHFGSGWSKLLYAESTVANIERHVTDLQRQETEKDRKRLARETFQPKFEMFKSRAETLELVIEYGDDSVKLAGDYYGKPYTEEGLAAFVADIDASERQAAEAKAKADAEAAYQLRKTRAQKLNFPIDIRIWCRRGGRTNAGDGWVIGPDGQDRGNTTWYNPRPRYPDEGDKIWEQILESELVLKWSKGSSAASHEFEIVHRPPALTEAQLERVREIEDELEKEWEGARGLASGIPSPSVGEGWGLVSRIPPIPEPNTKSVAEGGESASQDAIATLKAKFGGGR